MNENERKQIEAFIRPESVAVIGATDRFGSWGSFIMKGLLSWEFPGRIYPVNPNASTVSGIKAYSNILSIPDQVDLVVLTIPSESVLETIRACAEKGVKGITIITAGFGEAVESGREKEVELAQLARQHRMRLLGPNVSGTFNLYDHFNASASPANFLIPTPITAVCQGSYAIYDLLVVNYWRKMGVGHFIQTGNECDLEVTDFLDYFGDDPRTGAILMYLESLRDVDRFRDVASRVALKKPLIVFKAGSTPGGSRAARSHTGAIAGDHAIYRALFRQMNIVPSHTMELLIPLGHAFLDLPPMRGNRVAIVTMGGSWGVALTDMLEEKGLLVPELGSHLQEKLREIGMPLRASTRNPIDIGAAGSIALSAEAVVEMSRMILHSDEVDALVLHGFGRLGLVMEDSSPGTNVTLELEKDVMRKCSRLMENCNKPVLIGSAIFASQSRAVHDLAQEGHLIFHHLDEIADVLSLKFHHHHSFSP